MKTLWLIRHAKSSWADAEQADIERPLNERGYQDLRFMPERMSSAGVPLPEIFISSPAIRAYSTALIYAQHLRYPAEKIVLRDSLYESSVFDYLEVIARIEQPFESAVVFGHNPVLTQLINRISNATLDNLPTCGIAGVAFKTNSWTDVLDGEGVIRYFDFPKNPAT